MTWLDITVLTTYWGFLEAPLLIFWCIGGEHVPVLFSPADFLPPVSPLDGLLHPQALMKSSEEVQQRLGSQPLPVWEWSTDWVDEMEAKYMQPAEDWEAAVKPGKARIAAPEEAQLVPTSIQQGMNDKCCCSKVEGHLPGILK